MKKHKKIIIFHQVFLSFSQVFFVFQSFFSCSRFFLNSKKIQCFRVFIFFVSSFFFPGGHNGCIVRGGYAGPYHNKKKFLGKSFLFYNGYTDIEGILVYYANHYSIVRADPFSDLLAVFSCYFLPLLFNPACLGGEFGLAKYGFLIKN